VITFEYDSITAPEQIKHMWGDDAGIGTIPEPYTIFPYDKSAGFGSVMGGSKGFDHKISYGKMLMIPAFPVINLFI
jgi:hypothetical protein